MKNQANLRPGGLDHEFRQCRRVDRPWSEYPLGTKALALMGGHWLRVERGWKWQPNGGTFPAPGGDAFNVVLPKQEAQEPAASA
ncbi:hypothetical protein [Sphingomonas sp. 3-13AW]|uniref:hypothetical protein n=1 Tax=Sphingomonas sp. 3-13AW TaxID=3050450 RepID=UPI003BB80A27